MFCRRLFSAVVTHRGSLLNPFVSIGNGPPTGCEFGVPEMGPISQKPLADQTSRTGAALAAILFFSCAGCSQLPKFQTHSPRPQFFVEDSRTDVPAPMFEMDEDEQPTQVASADDLRGLVSRPSPFAWKAVAQSAGGRDIETATIGRGGYRTLIIASLAGDDPIAVELTEQLARHIHSNSIILGGIVATVVRNPNPDGAAAFRSENGNGVYLNEVFPPASNISQDRLNQEPEIRFLLGALEDEQPQRVIHIRTTSQQQGLVAASSGASRVGKDLADWLKFRFIPLPGRSGDGTLERLVSESQSSEIITIAVPQDADRSTLWEDYRDSLLNLLLDEDFETRKLARQQKASEFADRRGKNRNGAAGDD